MVARTVVPEIASFKSLVGMELGPSDWTEVSQERIDAFAAATGDDQWIHTDPERARRESPFGGTIAHGHLTLSLAPRLLRDILDLRSFLQLPLKLLPLFGELPQRLVRQLLLLPEFRVLTRLREPRVEQDQQQNGGDPQSDPPRPRNRLTNHGDGFSFQALT